MDDRCTCGRLIPVAKGDHASLDHCSREILQTDEYICDLMTEARVKVLRDAAKRFADARHNDPAWGAFSIAWELRAMAAKIRRKARKHG